MSRYRIRFSLKAESAAAKIDVSVLARIRIAIETKLSVDPIRFGKPLGYSLRQTRALRVGDWRVLYILSGTEVVILTMRHRKEGYDDFR